jgi:hypothetical protein
MHRSGNNPTKLRFTDAVAFGQRPSGTNPLGESGSKSLPGLAEPSDECSKLGPWSSLARQVLQCNQLHYQRARSRCESRGQGSRLGITPFAGMVVVAG